MQSLSRFFASLESYPQKTPLPIIFTWTLVHTPSFRREQERGRIIRSRSESEMETDVERERIIRRRRGSDSLSNASDDIYLERYCTKFQSSRDSHSRGSSERREKKKPTIGKIQETCRETMRQFNRMDLDDSCTTPTSGSSQPYAETQSPARIRTSLYSCGSGDQVECERPQPPSLDSGYGASPVASRSEQNSIKEMFISCTQPLPILVEMSTQTESTESVNGHEYTELESLRRGTQRAKFPPRLCIPPPPRHPIPPVPNEVMDGRNISNRKKTLRVSTNV